VARRSAGGDQWICALAGSQSRPVAYVRTAQAASAAVAVQIVYASQRGSQSSEHLALRMPPEAGGAQGHDAAAVGGRAR
jgi:hypothetical protein